MRMDRRNFLTAAAVTAGQPITEAQYSEIERAIDALGFVRKNDANLI